MKTKYEEFISEGVISTVRNKIKNFDRYGSQLKDKQEEVIGLLKALITMNDNVELISGGVKITRNDNIYYVYTNGKIVFPMGSELYIDEDIAKNLFYEFIKKK